MKKILSTLFLITILMITTGCALKEPFQKATIIEETALVYIYRIPGLGLDDINYKIYVDDKYTHQLLKANEYFPFHIKYGNVTISAIANGLIEHEVTIYLEEAKDYFLKITPTEGDDFTIEAVKETQALKEIVTTVLSGSEIEEDPALSKVVEEKKSTPSQQLSASDEITRLYEMKEKGIITEAEYKTLKAKVIAK